MSKLMYTTVRPEVETSKRLEKRIMNYAKKKKVRMPRARRQLIEKGLAVVETKLPEMTETEEKVFQKKIKRLHLLIRKKRKGGEK